MPVWLVISSAAAVSGRGRILGKCGPMEARIDMSKALHWLEEENLKRTIRDRLLPVVVMLKVVAKTLTEFPDLNGFWIDGGHHVAESINIGFAINLRKGGLMTPAIHNTDMKSYDELREAVNDLIVRTRNNKLRSSELTDQTITLTSAFGTFSYDIYKFFLI